MSVAVLDPDAVWMLLYDVVSAGAGAAGKGAEVPFRHQRPVEDTADQTRCSTPTPTLSPLPPLPVWKPVRSGSGGGGTRVEGGSPASGQWPVNAALASDCCEVARQMLRAVEILKPPWHKAAPLIAPDWRKIN